jgi:hypothetical protein
MDKPSADMVQPPPGAQRRQFREAHAETKQATAPKFKTPTASGISRLLAGTGFRRAIYEHGCLDRAGFAVTEAGSGAGVRVEHDTTLPDHRQPILERCARTITGAGWAVEPVSYAGGAIHHLIVTAAIPPRDNS